MERVVFRAKAKNHVDLEHLATMSMCIQSDLRLRRRGFQGMRAELGLFIVPMSWASTEHVAWDSPLWMAELGTAM